MNEKLAGMLSDKDIRQHFGKKIKIYTEERTGEYSFNLDKQLQLASVDLRFRNECKRFAKKLDGNLDYDKLKNHAYTEPFEIKRGELLVIQPGEIIFTTTLETINISNEFAGIITGRSSIARMGIMVHCCQEFINPGQGAPIALQIVNLGKHPVELDMRIPICQLIIFQLCSPASNLYSQMEDSKYSNEKEFLPSKIHEEATPDFKTKTKIKFPKLKSFMQKTVSAFAPGIITFLLIDPILGTTQNISISDLFSYLIQTPVSLVVLIGTVILFYVFGKDDN